MFRLEVCMGMVGILRNLWEIHRNTTRMELKLTGFPQVWDLLLWEFCQEIRQVRLDNLGIIKIIHHTLCPEKKWPPKYVYIFSKIKNFI